MTRTYDEVMQEVAQYVPRYLFEELNQAIEQEIVDVESCYAEGSSEVLNEW